MRRRTHIWIGACAIVLAAGLCFSFVRMPDLFVYNETASMPVGLYWRTHESPGRGSIVTLHAARVARAYALQRGFAEAGDRFIKRVVGVDGDLVCADGASVTINGAEIARRASIDSRGRPLPSWQGCRRLDGEVFVLGDSAESFDSRYFGPVALCDIEAVWTR